MQSHAHKRHTPRTRVVVYTPTYIQTSCLNQYTTQLDASCSVASPAPPERFQLLTSESMFTQQLVLPLVHSSQGTLRCGCEVLLQLA